MSSPFGFDEGDFAVAAGVATGTVWWASVAKCIETVRRWAFNVNPTLRGFFCAKRDFVGGADPFWSALAGRFLFVSALSMLAKCWTSDEGRRRG